MTRYKLLPGNSMMITSDSEGEYVKHDDAQADKAQLETEIANAMQVLGPSMPESGLVDACKQIKQAAISEADNSEKLEAQLTSAEEQIAWAARHLREALSSDLGTDDLPTLIGAVQAEIGSVATQKERQAFGAGLLKGPAGHLPDGHYFWFRNKWYDSLDEAFAAYQHSTSTPKAEE